MTIYKLFWICFKAIIRGKGFKSVSFDTEARTFKYHLAAIGSAYYEKHSWPDGELVLYEKTL